MIGQLVDGKYQIVRLLGEGGMGAVYEAVHSGTGRRVALKVIISADLTKNQDMVARFQREAKAAGAVDTQHIVQVLDTGRDPTSGFPFMVMEFLAGGDVEQLLQRTGPIPPELALRIAAQACIGLQKAHDANVVHRDIKPANLYLARRDAGEVVVKVLDFGIAKVKMDQASSSEGHSLTRTGSMLGSPLYMSPEQAKGLKTIDERTDLWSLGAVLYEVLSGRTPHHHVDTLGQLIIAICSEAPRPIQEIAPWVPPEVAAIVHRALQPDVNERFQSAKAMFDAIIACLPQGYSLNEEALVGLSDVERGSIAPRLATSAPGIARGVTSPGSTQGAGVSAVTDNGVNAALSSTAVKPPKRSATLPLIIAAVVVLGGGGFAALSLRSKPAPATDAVTTPPAAISVASAAPPSSAPVVTASDSTAAATRNVKVVIVPRNASVEIDGVAATATDGLLDISGTLGSVHAVRVFQGTHETRSDVVIAEGGAIPPKVELGAAVGAASPAKSVAAKTGAAPGPPATVHAATAPPGAARTFE